jgi:hypothetical protein
MAGNDPKRAVDGANNNQPLCEEEKDLTFRLIPHNLQIMAGFWITAYSEIN